MEAGGAPAAGVWTELAKAARARAAELGPPTQGLEDWRAVDPRPLQAALAAPQPQGGGAGVPVRFTWDDAADLAVTPLMELPAAEGAALAARWRAQVAAAGDASACWAHAEAGPDWHLGLPQGAQARFGIAVAFANGGVRFALALAPGASMHLVLDQRAGPGLAQVLIDAELGAGAALTVEERQRADGPHAVFLARRFLRLERGASVTWTTIAEGAALARFATVVELAGVGARADLAGLARPRGRDQVHHHLRVRHRVGPTASFQQFRAIVADQARAGCDALARIDPGADGSEARQRLANLLLSPQARADARPRLDIAADDVQASHGAATGSLDREELFYLRARGLDATAATALLVEGFAATVLARLHSPAGRSWVGGGD
jgi:hypothetical protein